MNTNAEVTYSVAKWWVEKVSKKTKELFFKYKYHYSFDTYLNYQMGRLNKLDDDLVEMRYCDAPIDKFEKIFKKQDLIKSNMIIFIKMNLY